MKNLLLFLCLLFAAASPARADDLGGNIYWNSVTNSFQALTKALGWKTIPDTESGSFQLTFSGAFSSSPVYTWTRVGKIVTMYIAQDISGSSCAAATMSASGAVPSSIRPAQSSTNWLIPVADAGTSQNTPGAVTITSAGTVSITKQWNGAGTFSNTGTCGNYPSQVTYAIP